MPRLFVENAILSQSRCNDVFANYPAAHRRLLLLSPLVIAQKFLLPQRLGNAVIYLPIIDCAIAELEARCSDSFSTVKARCSDSSSTVTYMSIVI
jgi:hypothetical protein